MKLYFKYGAMNSGKTMEILRTAHNYEENGYKVLIVKPFCDTKGNDFIVSRVGVSRHVDYLLKQNELLSDVIKQNYPTVILVDEAQFLSKEQIDDLWLITKNLDIDVFCYGLRTDFRLEGFPGAIRLFELADKIEEITTLCRCGNKANANLRLVDGVPTFDGDEVAIDGFLNVTYIPVCSNCYIDYYNKAKEQKMVRKKIF